MMMSLWGTPIWRPETSENIWNLLWLSQRLANIHVDASLALLAFQTSKNTLNRYFHVHNMLVSRYLYVTHWQNLKFKLLYFQNKARYQAENMRSDIFLKCLLREEAKNGKVSLLFNFSFCLWRHVKTKNNLPCGWRKPDSLAPPKCKVSGFWLVNHVKKTICGYYAKSFAYINIMPWGCANYEI